MSHIKYSIVIPTYNRAKYLKKNLNKILNLNYKNYEVILVDNNSLDKTNEIVKNYTCSKKLIYLRNKKNFERSYSRNLGIKISKGEFITFLDSDDNLEKNFFNEFDDFYKKNKNIKIFYSNYIIKKNNKKKFVSLKSDFILKDLLNGNKLTNIGVLFHKSVFEKISWDENLNLIGSEDYDFILRMIINNNIALKFSNKYLCTIVDHKNRSVHLEKSKKKLNNRIDYFKEKLFNKKTDYKNVSLKYKKKILGSVYFALCYECIVNNHKLFFNFFINAIKNNVLLVFTKQFIYLIFIKFYKILIR